MQNNNNTSDDAKLIITPREQIQINNNLTIPVTPEQPIICKEPPDIKKEHKQAKEKFQQARLKM